MKWIVCIYSGPCVYSVDHMYKKSVSHIYIVDCM